MLGELGMPMKLICLTKATLTDTKWKKFKTRFKIHHLAPNYYKNIFICMNTFVRAWMDDDAVEDTKRKWK